jgi:putative hemolysin
MLEIFIIALCLLSNALLSGAEMAFVTASKPRLRELSRSGNKVANRILLLRENPERTLSVIQVGITLVGAIAAAIGGVSSEELLSPIFEDHLKLSEPVSKVLGIIVVVIPLTFLNVVVGELVPKTLALRNPLQIVLRSARWLVLFERILTPIVNALEWSTKRLLRLLFWKSKPEPANQTNTVELDQLSHQTRQYVLNLVGVEKKRIKDVLLPWNQVVAVDIKASSTQIEKVVLASGHTRLPVLEEGRAVGILNTKEFMSLKRSEQATDTNWITLIRPIVQVQEADSLLKAFRHMQEKRSHLSVAYSKDVIVGIVTMEDILEEVMGDIYDEDDDGTLRRILSSSATIKKISP